MIKLIENTCSIGKTELAMQCFPDLSPNRARNKLMEHLKGDTETWQSLIALNYKNTQQQFLGKQIDVVLELFK